MAKAQAIYWVYRSYTGDKYFMNESELFAKVPNSKPRIVKRGSYLSQKGFGYGYYNSSGSYFVAIKFAVKGDVDVSALPTLGGELFSTEEEFKFRVKSLTAHAKDMNRRNPF